MPDGPVSSRADWTGGEGASPMVPRLSPEPRAATGPVFRLGGWWRSPWNAFPFRRPEVIPKHSASRANTKTGGGRADGTFERVAVARDPCRAAHGGEALRGPGEGRRSADR